MPPEKQEADTTNDDPFSSAFAEFSIPGDTDTPTVPKKTEEPAAAAEEPPVEEGEEGEEPPVAEGEEPPVEEGEEPPAEGEAPPAKGEKPKEKVKADEDLSDDELLDRFARIMSEKVKTEPKSKTESSEPQRQQEPETPPVYTPEEEQFLNQYKEDWPDVAKAESLIRRAEYQQIVSYVFQQVASSLRPVVEQVQAVAEHTHYSQLGERVSDYDDVRDKVVEWAENQPDYLRAAYERVINEGTVDEIADLIDRYRKETGAAAPAAPAQKQDAELPATTKTVAASLAPVSSKRSSIPKGDDLHDFDAAFSKFADLV